MRRGSIHQCERQTVPQARGGPPAACLASAVSLTTLALQQKVGVLPTAATCKHAMRARTSELKLVLGTPGQPWLEWPVWLRASHSVWGSSAVQQGLFPPAFLLLWGLAATKLLDAQCLHPAGTSRFWWVSLAVSLCCAGVKQAARWVGWVPGDLGQGHGAPGLLAQGPTEASLGAEGCGGEGKVLWLKFELQMVGGQGVIRLAGGLQGGQGMHENAGVAASLAGAKRPPQALEGGGDIHEDPCPGSQPVACQGTAPVPVTHSVPSPESLGEALGGSDGGPTQLEPGIPEGAGTGHHTPPCLSYLGGDAGPRA